MLQPQHQEPSTKNCLQNDKTYSLRTMYKMIRFMYEELCAKDYVNT